MKNVEFKASVSSLEKYETILKNLGANFIGLDHQIDTYFNANYGRLKLREGTIENALIQYHRDNSYGQKLSEIILYNHSPSAELKQILTTQLGIKCVVDKKRHIYRLENVKFHLDIVQNLGMFVEVEVIDIDGTISQEKLETKCTKYREILDIQPTQIEKYSYSDMLMKKK